MKWEGRNIFEIYIIMEHKGNLDGLERFEGSFKRH